MDRILDFSVVDNRGEYIDTPIDLEGLYEEIVGVTLDQQHEEPEDIYFTVNLSLSITTDSITLACH